MRLEADGSGTFSLELSAPLGKGKMAGYAVSPNVIVSEVDFRCSHCPNMTGPGTVASDDAHSGRWFTVNRCIEGRRETVVPDLGVAVVSEGDVCMSASHILPDAFSHPLSRYRGVELFVNTNIANEREFCLLEEAGVSATTLNGCFAKLYGMTIAAYARRRRMECACEFLSAGESVSAVAFKVGYSNPSKFAAAFKRETGVSPSELLGLQWPVNLLRKIRRL